MATYLLAWNPRTWTWSDLNVHIDEIVTQGLTVRRWSCGNTRTIQLNDRIFLIRLGLERRGIMGAGRVIQEPYSALHWDRNRAAQEQMALYVEVEFDNLIDPDQTPELMISYDVLQQPPFHEFHWSIQKSGVRIPDAVAQSLEQSWRSQTADKFAELPEEVGARSLYIEGARRQIYVNVYERSPTARRACIAHYGAVCSVCDFDFSKQYGIVAEGFIHVHHIVPLSTIRLGYLVDPIRDLCPVCPNCHAVIHLRVPAYSIDEVRSMLQLG